MRDRRLWIVALLSMSLIALEIVWTRIFSAEFFYTFAFLALSLAVLGLGLGALAVRLRPGLVAPERSARALLLAGFAALAGPPAVLRLGLDFGHLADSVSMALRFVLLVVVLAAPFFLSGIGLAALFRRNHRDMPRVYMADLLGAGGGALLAIATMNLAGVPYAAILVCLPLLAAAVLSADRLRLVHGAALAVVATMLFFAWPLVDIARKEPGPVGIQHWDAMGRLKVHFVKEDYRNINIDNAANTPVTGLKGPVTPATADPRNFMFNIGDMMRGREGYRLASLGAGGGNEVLQGLVQGAGEIHAVEVNGAINRMMTDGELAEFSGRIYQDPKVRVVTEDGRAYLRRFTDHFDIIVSSSSNSFAALASGAFALSENYLFTTEAFEEYLRALKPNGLLLMEHQFYIPRAVSEAKDALAALGVADPAAHIAVYDLPKHRRNVLLVGRAPLTEADRLAVFGPIEGEVAELVAPLWPAPEGKDNLVARILRNGWESEAAAAPHDLRPCTDDRPFIAQMGLWRNVSPDKLASLKPFEFFGFPLTKLILLAILGIIAVLVVPVLFLPYRGAGERLGPAGWGYFFAIGVGFMVVEVVLIQQFTLLIGSSAYTVLAILLTLLAGSGIGSRFAGRVADWVPFAGIGAWLLLDVLLFPSFVSAAGALGLAWRLPLAILAIAPLGFFMGMPFPKAALRAGELVDWGFAVNGAASAIGSALILLVAMTWGFRVALGAGALCYGAAFALLALRQGWVRAAKPAVVALAEPEPVALTTVE